jgi:Ca2+-binding RTX toxin-like protein
MSGQGFGSPFNVDGTAGHDSLEDTAYWTVVNAGNGNDVIFAFEDFDWTGGEVADTFNGGAGTDTVSYIRTARYVSPNDGFVYPHYGVDGDLDTGVVRRKFLNQTLNPDGLISIENLEGSIGPDTLRGNTGNNKLWGADGNDLLFGRDGNDSLYGGNGNDQLWGGNHNDRLQGDGGNDTLNGDDGADSLFGGNGNDLLNGGTGNDELDGGAGNDVMHGNGGVDTAVFTTNGSVQVNLGLGITAGALGNDTLYSIENARTGNGGDVVFGSNGANAISTGAGNDYADGSNGNDTIFGGAGADTVLGGAGHDSLHGDQGGGAQGDDSISGGSGNDTIFSGNGTNSVRGGSGADLISLGTGSDTLRYGAGEIGMDEVYGFDLTEDLLVLEPGLFGAALGPGETLEDVLLVFNAPGIGCILFAETASDGLEAIARFHGITQAQMEAAIAGSSDDLIFG